jgi:hypothetical protein
MIIIYTYHAKQQIKKRKILKIWVEETIKFPDKIKSNKNRHYVIKKLNSKVLKVVFVKEKYIKIITSYFVK